MLAKVRGLKAKGEGRRAKGKGWSFAFSPLFFAFFCFFFLLPFALCPSPFAQPSIRVLLVDSKNARIPQKDEKIERVGGSKGEVILSGLKYSGDIEVWKSDKGLYIINEI